MRPEAQKGGSAGEDASLPTSERAGPKRPASGEQSGAALRGPWWFRRRSELSDEQRTSLFAQLFFEGPDRLPFLSRFAVLLALSILIAAFGLATDSAPVVIGAMLVSPLTTPLLGLCASLVLGWPRRQLESVAILILASVLGIGLAWLVMAAIPEPESITRTSRELVARTNPQLLDLAIAIAAGAAGAYVLVRREAIGALPGVAIAVALVPPLTAVGMMLQLGEPGLAGEALLLYVTNLAGIVLSGSLVMLLLGVQPERIKGSLPTRTRVGMVAALAVALALVLPLQKSTRQTVSEATNVDAAQRAAERWAAVEDLELKRVTVENDLVDIDVAGLRMPRNDEVDELATELASHFGRPIELKVGWSRQVTFDTNAEP
jgi:uncharacterized hydrophobic protein (TIGR00271 family)